MIVFIGTAQRRGKCAQKNYIKACDKDGNTALHLAVQNGSSEVNLYFMNVHCQQFKAPLRLSSCNDDCSMLLCTRSYHSILLNYYYFLIVLGS